MISDKSIQEIKTRIDIVEVIGDFVNLKRSGSNYKALSPFTSEKTPSFFVSPSKEIYKCFSSGKGGDAIDFVMEIEGINYIEALKYLAKKYGIDVEETQDSAEDIQLQNERESLFIIMDFAKKYFIENLTNTGEGKSIGLSYFRERGFNDEIIKKFDLGYSMKEWDGLLKYAAEKKYGADLLEKSGLVIRKDDKTYDRFRGRVIFPVHNLTGKTVAFGARILTSDKSQPKYINSPETPIYHKSDILYGIYQGRQAIRLKENCYLVEGYTDVISLHLSGVENVVASSGTSLTENQIKLIKRYSENVTVLFDGDPAGIKASLRGIDLLLESGLNVRAVIFPDGEDPDSYSRKIGANAFRDYLDTSSKDFISFKADLYALDSKGDPIKKAGTIKEIVASIAKIPDPVKRAVYIKETSVLLDIDEPVLIAELNKLFISERNRNRNIPPDPGLPPVERTIEVQPNLETLSKESIRLQERESIRLLISYGTNKIEEENHLYEYILHELEDVEFTTPIYREIFEIFKENLRSGHVIDAKYLIQNAGEEIRNEVINIDYSPYELSKNWISRKIFITREEDQLNIAAFKNILRLKHKIVSKLIADTLDEMKSSEEADEIERLLKVKKELDRINKDLTEKLGIIIS